MNSIKCILLLTLVSLSYQAFHCLDSFKTCNIYGSTTVSHCLLGAAYMCMQCEENYSLSNERTECLNVANCNYFDDEGSCPQCSYYYNFDSDGNCVRDNCLTYDSNKNCIQCYPRFYLNSKTLFLVRDD